MFDFKKTSIHFFQYFRKSARKSKHIGRLLEGLCVCIKLSAVLNQIVTQTNQNKKSFCYSRVFCIQITRLYILRNFRSNRSEVFLGEGVLKTCSKFTVEYPCPNCTSASLFFCKFAACFRETFP